MHPAQSPEPALLDESAFAERILFEDEHFLAVDKPGWIVCHPSKNGPFSSLAGTARVYLGATKDLHLLSRLDRETSGVVVFGKHRKAARIVQTAFEQRHVKKLYWGVCEGSMTAPGVVKSGFSPDRSSPVHVKQRPHLDPSLSPNRLASTFFFPLDVLSSASFLKIETDGGKKHQIRAHAQWLGFPLRGEKLYGRDETFYLEFVSEGWTQRLEENLRFPRQALHAARLVFAYEGCEYDFRAPWPSDWDTSYPGYEGRDSPDRFEFIPRGDFR